MAELLQVDYEMHGMTRDPLNLALRRYAGMTLTNLTFGDVANKVPGAGGQAWRSPGQSLAPPHPSSEWPEGWEAGCLLSEPQFPHLSSRVTVLPPLRGKDEAPAPAHSGCSVTAGQSPKVGGPPSCPGPAHHGVAPVSPAGRTVRAPGLHGGHRGPAGVRE